MPRFPLLYRCTPPLVGVLIAVCIVSVARRPFRSFDTYFHLRFGEEFLSDWSVSAPGHPSDTGTNNWVPTQWLAQVGLTATERTAGSTGLAVLFATLVLAFAVALYLLARQAGNPMVASLATAAALLGCHAALSLRPQMVSFLLTIVVIASWHLARRTGRCPWWLVPIGWLWAVSHGMWILGIAISAVLAVAVVVERRPDRAGAARLLLVPVGMLIAACLTPAGPRLVSAVLLVNSRAEHFVEWGAPELATLGIAPLTALAAVAVLLAARRGGLTPYELAMLGLAGAFTVYSLRTLPVAAAFIVWILSAEVQKLRSTDTHRRVRRPELMGVLLVAGLAVALVPLLPGDRDDGAAQDLRPFEDELQALDAGSVVLTDRRYGSAMLWTDPELDIPVHGYGDVYTDDELDDLDDMRSLEPGWDATLRRVGAATALLEVDDRLTYALENAGWVAAQESNGLMYLTAPTGWLDQPLDLDGAQDDAAATQRSSAD